MKQNITLSLDREIIRKGKVIAAKKDLSVSKMIGELLRELVENDDQYKAEKKVALKTLEEGLCLGGKISWKREELYER